MTSLPVERTYHFGGYVLEPRERRLWHHDTPVQLSGKALELLVILVSHAGQVVTRDVLLATIWPDSAVEDSNVTVHIGALRRTLDGMADAIETVPRLGYRFTAPVTTVETPTGASPAPPPPPQPPHSRARPAARVQTPLVWTLGALIIVVVGWMLVRSPMESFSVTVTPQENLPVAGCCNAAFTLDDGRVLIGSGVAHSQNQASRMNPWVYERRLWIQDVRLRTPTQVRDHPDMRRDAPTSTRLADGRILIAGGYGCVDDDTAACRFISRGRAPLATAVIYDPATESATPVAGGMHRPHAGHTATRLGDGTVLIVGGYHGPPESDDWGTVVELFDPSAPEGAQFRLLEPLSAAVLQGVHCDTCAGDVRKAEHTATLLPDGSVLIAGGWRGPSAAGHFDGALRYRPGSPGLTLASPTGRPFVRAASATATLLGDGRVLFAGGTRDFSMAGSLEPVLATTVLYDFARDQQTLGPALSVPRVGHSATAISPQSVVFIGGMRCDVSVEQIHVKGPHVPSRAPCDANPSGDILTIVGARSRVSRFPMVSGHAYHATTVLRDGRIYIPGGLTKTGTPTISALTVAVTRR